MVVVRVVVVRDGCGSCGCGCVVVVGVVVVRVEGGVLVGRGCGFVRREGVWSGEVVVGAEVVVRLEGGVVVRDGCGSCGGRGFGREREGFGRERSWAQRLWVRDGLLK